MWQRKRDGWWMATLNDTQMKLAFNEKKALNASHELMARSPDAPVETIRLTFRRLADRFLAHCKRTVTDSTFQLRPYLQSFSDHIKKLVVSNLRVQSTNNAADRAVRHAVCWRKRSYLDSLRAILSAF
jgi:hypothetical protein